MKNKSKIIITLLLILMSNFNTKAKSNYTTRPHCISFSCCSYSFLGATINIDVLSGKICFDAVARNSNTNKESGNLTLVKIIMDKSIPEAGLLIVKKDDIIVDDETGETYLVARGTYEVNEDGSCFLNIHKNNN